MANPITLKYKRRDYEEKLNKLRTYLNQLETHLATMRRLRSEMFQFWNDSEAMTAGQLLDQQCNQVQRAMTRTSDLINFYSTTITDIDEHKAQVQGLLEGAQDALNMLDHL